MSHMFTFIYSFSCLICCLNLFLIREGNDETLYYSCKAHLDDLIQSLEEDGKEKRLLSALKAKYKLMVKHMEITEALTEAARGRTVAKTFLTLGVGITKSKLTVT